MSAVTDSSSDSEPPQFFHYARSAQHMMGKWDTTYSVGMARTSEKDDVIFYVISHQKVDRQITMTKHIGVWVSYTSTSYVVPIRRQQIDPIMFCLFI